MRNHHIFLLPCLLLACTARDCGCGAETGYYQQQPQPYVATPTVVPVPVAVPMPVAVPHQEIVRREVVRTETRVAPVQRQVAAGPGTQYAGQADSRFKPSTPAAGNSLSASGQQAQDFKVRDTATPKPIATGFGAPAPAPKSVIAPTPAPTYKAPAPSPTPASNWARPSSPTPTSNWSRPSSPSPSSNWSRPSSPTSNFGKR